MMERHDGRGRAPRSAPLVTNVHTPLAARQRFAKKCVGRGPSAAVARSVLTPGAMPFQRASFRALSLFALTSLAAAAAACDGDDDDDNDGVGTGSAALADACGRIFDAAQNVSDRCGYGEPLDDDLRPSERDGYVRWCSNVFGLPGVVSDVPSRLARCAADIRGLGCEALAGDDDLSCPEFEGSTGTLAAGAACDDEVQCESGSCSVSSVENLCGVCARAVGEGEACGEGGVTCAAGLLCRPPKGEARAICRAPRRVGEACENDCEAGSVCDGGVCKAPSSLPKAGEACAQRCAFGNACVDAVCVALPKENEPCLADESSAACAPGLRCNEAAQTCQRRFTGEVDPGGACGEDTYCKGGVCDGERCVAYAQVGEACDGNGQTAPGRPPPCAEGYECKAGACVAWAPSCPAGG